MKQIQIDLTPEEYASETAVRRAVAQAMGVREEELQPYRITRRSIDCRRRPLYHCIVEVGECRGVQGSGKPAPPASSPPCGRSSWA